MVKRIYKGFRGEGKTKWLVENAIDTVVSISTVAEVDATSIFYLGSAPRYDRFKKMYEDMMHTPCPITRWDHDDMRGCDAAILFTDELMDEINCIPSSLPTNGVWFITMSAEDFTN